MELTGCAICKEPSRSLQPVSWELVMNGEMSTFAVGCCPVDAFLCHLFPSLKRALWNSQAAQELLRRLIR